jgi:effector-binding domain-containing protein
VWLRDTLGDLRCRLGEERRVGPDGALYSSEFFEEHVGEVTAVIPVTGVPRDEVPGGAVAVIADRCSFAEFDRAYAALGAFVAERGLGAPGPIREHSLIGTLDDAADDEFVTEVCWPVTTAAEG